jgi:uncharacterized protein (DUF488 family)
MLYTIGHSNHDLDKFFQLLAQAKVTAIADVRSSPFSGRYAHYNRTELEGELAGHGIAYVFLGDLLGGRPAQDDLYDADGRVDYERVRATGAFRQGLDRLLRGLERFAIALLCAEEDPLDCHRGLMITPALRDHSMAPVHMRGDGTMETTAHMEERLLSETKVGAGILDGLFADMVSVEERQALLGEAYRVMARRKAFRWRPDPLALHDEAYT